MNESMLFKFLATNNYLGHSLTDSAWDWLHAIKQRNWTQLDDASHLAVASSHVSDRKIAFWTSRLSRSKIYDLLSFYRPEYMLVCSMLVFKQENFMYSLTAGPHWSLCTSQWLTHRSVHLGMGLQLGLLMNILGNIVLLRKIEPINLLFLNLILTLTLTVLIKLN